MRALLMLIVGSAIVATTDCRSHGASVSGSPSIPAAFRTACGHPGSHVTITKVQVTISHRVCDLTGVEVDDNGVGVTIPAYGETAAFLDTVSGVVQLVAEVDARTGDVTIHE